jgi:hypothetical protein
MTIIAYRDGVMAGDGRMSTKTGDIIFEDDTKVFKAGDYLLGVAGDADACEFLIDSVKKGYAPGKYKCTAMRVDRAGKIEVYEGSGWFPMFKGYGAIGAGDLPALVAMDAGADAVTACKAAIKRNGRCGGKIRTVKW